MSRGTTHRTVRIDDGLWEDAKAVADAWGEDLETELDLIEILALELA